MVALKHGGSDHDNLMHQQSESCVRGPGPFLKPTRDSARTPYSPAGVRRMHISSCSVRLWVRGCPPLKVCVYKVYKSLVPVLPCGAALLLVVLYSLAEQLLSFVCGIFMPQYHYPYAVPLALIQVLLNLLALQALRAVGLVRLKPFSWRLAEQLMVPAVCGSVQSVLVLWAESNAHSGLFPLTARLLPLLSLAWSHLLTLTTPGHAHFTILLVVVTFISVTITVCQGLYTIEPLEYLYSPLSLFLHSLSLSWLARVAQCELGGSSKLDLYYTLTVLRSLLLGLLCLVHPDGPRALAQGSWLSLLFLGYMLAVVLLGAVRGLLVDITAMRLSALSAAVLHSAGGLALPFYNLL